VESARWFNYIDPKDLHFRLRPVPEFVKGIPGTSEGFEKENVESSAGNLRASGQKGKDMILLYLQTANTRGGTSRRTIRPGQSKTRSKGVSLN